MNDMEKCGERVSTVVIQKYAVSTILRTEVLGAQFDYDPGHSDALCRTYQIHLIFAIQCFRSRHLVVK
jgi:hypothetical protein